MASLMHAARAYNNVAAKRGWRDQEADIFRRATGALRASRTGGATDRVRALVDNQRLWNMVRTMVRDPENRLDADLRGALVSVAMAVQREMDADSPDFDFLITINENITAGLAA